MRHVLVTGGAGYIGAHACKALARAGFVPVAFDNLSTGWEDAVKFGPFVKGDLMNRAEIVATEPALARVQDKLVGALQLPTDVAMAALRQMVQECESPRALRDFVASIVSGITVGPEEVRVEYHPECLVRSEGAAVRSTSRWLPVVGTLRTISIAIPMPLRVVLRRAA